MVRAEARAFQQYLWVFYTPDIPPTSREKREMWGTPHFSPGGVFRSLSSPCHAPSRLGPRLLRRQGESQPVAGMGTGCLGHLLRRSRSHYFAAARARLRT